MKQDMIVILDLGSHENTVLARAIRALGVYSEIYPHDITVEELKKLSNVKGIIINGGPCNIVDGVAIDVNPSIYEAGIPVMAAGHDKATCAVKLPQFTDDIEAIKAAVKPFVFETCKAEANWNMTNFVNDQIELVCRQVGDRKVLLALSGGVDSSVVAALLLKAIGNNLVCVHVNHGLMRKGESEDVVEMFGNQLKANLIYVDVTDRFLTKLEGVEDPEQKRKIIGGEFIRVFEEEARKLDGIDFLGQGTIYPDIVESGTKTAKPLAHVLGELDCDTLLLLFGLFIVIAGIHAAGVIDAAARLFHAVAGENPFRLFTLLVVVSVVLSAFIDNIPYVAAMLPVVQSIAALMNDGVGVEPYVFYFGLLTGATLGGNLTPIGASANIAAIGILRKNGETVTTRDFLRIGVPFTLAAVLAGYAYLWLVWGKV